MTLVPGPMASVPAEAIDVVAERERTAAVLDGPDRSHPLNSAGAALPTKAGVAAVIDHLLLEARIGGYEAAAAALPRLDAVYVAAAALIGAQPTDIALVESATVGWRRIVDALRLGPGDRVVATRSTYVSSALQLLELERSGVVIDLVPEDPATGATDLDALDAALALPAALLAATHVPTSSGLVEPVAEIGARARAAGVTYLLDATQSVGQLPVDVGTIGCDALVTTGRKFLRAPRGTGFLYLSPELCARLRPTSPDVRGARWVGERSFELGATARRFESWEAAHALRLGLGVALAETAALGVDRIARHVVELGALLRARLAAEVDGIRIADPEQAASGIVTFVRDGEDPRDTLAQLTAAGCNVVVVPAAHGLWDLSSRGYEAVVRASVHVYNGEDDVDAMVAALTAGPRPGAGSTPVPRRVARPSRSAEADVVVVGGGVHGRSAAWQLARRGRSVTLLEQFRLGHDAGSSHGRTRMIRRAYPSPVWDGLVDRAYGAWADLEAASGTTLLTTTGGLFARAREADGGLRGPGCELLDAAAARRIAPALTLGDE
ncbi:MAG TPA: aminotransferase class V-fold PLP-dependent enzyme, partial [Baekduia sp.]|nr:aminotransferase class V-fold PLP-dependent enzyme [Baekduia sp.]